MATSTPNYNFTLPGVNDPADANIWGTELNNNFTNLDTDLKSVSDAANSGVPIIGEMRIKAGQTIPTGWLLCYGQSVSRTTYAALFSEIGIAWGSADGSSFNIPDMRGRAPFGVDNMGGVAANRVTFAVSGITGSTLGSVGGDQVVGPSPSLTSAVTDPKHVHQTIVPNTTYVPSQAGAGGASVLAGVGTNTGSNLVNCNNTMTSVATGITVATTDNATGTGANMPPAAMCYFIIYSGV